MTSFKRCFLIPIWFLAVFSVGLGQTKAPSAPTPNQLAPEAQEAVHKGVLAAKQGDYLLAIRFFQDARKVAPQAPEIYYDLGLAESKIPGRELRAIAWFGAYLAVNPNAPNAAVVKEQIDVLDVTSQSNNTRLVKSVQDAASRISDRYRELNLRQIAKLWAGTGDLASALTIVNLLQSDREKSLAQTAIAEAQVQAGDIAGAQKTADASQYPSVKDLAMSAIVKAQLKAGDIASALRTVILIQNDDDKKDEAYDGIFEAQLKAGDIAGAQNTVGFIKNRITKAYSLSDIAIAQVETGEISAAQKTTDSIPDGDYTGYRKCEAKTAIAEAQARAGDTGSAHDTLASALKAANLDTSRKPEALDHIAAAQARVGDIAGALKTADLIEHASAKSYALAVTVDAQVKAGDITGALKTTDFIIPDGPHSNWKSDALTKIAGAQARAGDVAGAFKTADLVHDAYYKGAVVFFIVDGQAQAGDISGAFKTANLIQDTFWKKWSTESDR